MAIATIEWMGKLPGKVRMIDQTKLPGEKTFLELDDIKDIWDAIKRLSVRGAPAIGIAGAMGIVAGIQNSTADNTETLLKEVDEAGDYLATSRPTAVNLFWAIDRMKRVAHSEASLSVQDLKKRLLEEAIEVLEEDKRLCRAIGKHGQELVKDGSTLLTHCNAGGLATGDYGTALAVMFSAKEAGKTIKVYADETRPLLQGARLTTFELMEADIDVTLICDNMAAHCMKKGMIDMVVVGADRIAANGDAANKIGTYGVAILAKHHNVPFYVAAPSSTFDMKMAGGEEIPIEEREPEEVTCGFGTRTAPEGVKVFSPAFDVTPHELIAGIITEKGVIENPDTEKVAAVLNG